MNRLIIRKLTFEAAHYLPNHPKCGAIHGHTYVIRNLEIDVEEFLDFGEIKSILVEWDHRFIIPREHVNFWLDTVGNRGFQVKTKCIDGDPTVENISKALLQELLKLPHKKILHIRFELYEGLNAGVICEWPET